MRSTLETALRLSKDNSGKWNEVKIGATDWYVGANNHGDRLEAWLWYKNPPPAEPLASISVTLITTRVAILDATMASLMDMPLRTMAECSFMISEAEKLQARIAWAWLK